MKRIFVILLGSVLFFFCSCISSKSTAYVLIPEDYTSVYVILDSNKTTLSSGGYISYANNSMTYIPSHTSEAVLNTVKNNILIQTSLQQKGYKVVSQIEDADIVLLGGYETNDFYTDVILALYDQKSNELLFTAEGRYGYGLGIQEDVNGAVKEALKQIPSK